MRWCRPSPPCRTRSHASIRSVPSALSGGPHTENRFRLVTDPAAGDTNAAGQADGARGGGETGLAPTQEARAEQTETDREQRERLRGDGDRPGRVARSRRRSAGAPTGRDGVLVAAATTERERRRGGESQSETEQRDHREAHWSSNLLSMLAVILKARAEALTRWKYYKQGGRSPQTPAARSGEAALRCTQHGSGMRLSWGFLRGLRGVLYHGRRNGRRRPPGQNPRHQEFPHRGDPLQGHHHAVEGRAGVPQGTREIEGLPVALADRV